ncbi:MAG: sulfite exporter TauE/SafE family protein [Candidatus Zixiibacteriota bacterium]
MTDILLYLSCGLVAGGLGGYLGLGGGIVMVPYLTVVAGLDIATAVPVSVTAIVVNSFSASNEYVKKGMVDFELVVLLSLLMVAGSITGSSLSHVVPPAIPQTILTLLLVYTAFSLLKSNDKSKSGGLGNWHRRHLPAMLGLAGVTGILAGLVGIGGGVILVPAMHLIMAVPLTTARGTSSFLIGFSSAAASAVYLLNGDIDFHIAAPVILGILIGGKLGGFFGTTAKPTVIKVMFLVVMLYLAYKLTAPIIEAL